MNTLDAAHRIGLEYPGGIKALAVRMGISPAVLTCKLNPNTTTHHLTMIETERLQHMTGRHDVLQAMADILGYVCVPKPDAAAGDISHALAVTCAEFGDYLRAIDEANNDGVVTLNERKRLEGEFSEMIAAASALLASITSKSR